jgi:hypothetical protein
VNGMSKGGRERRRRRLSKTVGRRLLKRETRLDRKENMALTHCLLYPDFQKSSLRPVGKVPTGHKLSVPLAVGYFKACDAFILLPSVQTCVLVSII